MDMGGKQLNTTQRVERIRENHDMAYYFEDVYRMDSLILRCGREWSGRGLCHS